MRLRQSESRAPGLGEEISRYLSPITTSLSTPATSATLLITAPHFDVVSPHFHMKLECVDTLLFHLFRHFISKSSFFHRQLIMSTVKIYPPLKKDIPVTSLLPQLLQTPSGLALLELQGVVNLPVNSDGESMSNIEIGRIDFPNYDPKSESLDWMNCVYMFVGEHQRLAGEVKKLPKPLAIIRRRDNQIKQGSGGSYEEKGEILEVVEIVKYFLKFNHRPEPVGTEHAPA